MSEVFAMLEIWIASSRSQQEKDMKISLVEQKLKELGETQLNKEEIGVI